MNGTKFLSSEQVARIWTTLRPDTIRELAAEGKLPVALWYEKEPFFLRDEKTIRALGRLSRANTR